MTALATAWVKIRPDTAGFRAETEKSILGDADSVGGRAGTVLGEALSKAFGRVLTGAGAKTGRSLGDEFADAFTKQATAKTRDTQVGPSKDRTRRQGQESGGSFADGFRRQLEQASKALPPLTVGVAKDAAEQQIRDLQARMQELSGKTVGVDLDAGAALAQVRELESQLRALAASSPNIQIKTDAAAALARLGQVTAAADKLDGRNVEVEVDVDADRATRTVSSLGGALAGGLGKVLSGLSSTASTFFEALSEGAVKAGGQITSSVASAAAGEAAMTAATGGLNLVMGALSAAVATAAAATVGLGVAFLALAPAMLTAGGLLGGLIGSLFGAVAAAGVLKLGLGGIGSALQAMSAAQDEASKSSASLAGAQSAIANASDQVKAALAAQANTRASVADAARRAAQQVADAERAVGQARAEAAQQAKDAQQRIGEAAQRVRDAQRTLTDAERDALQVRKDLTQAQEDAKQNLEDLASAVKSNGLDQRQAVLDVAEAQANLQKVLSDPRSTAEQRQQAQLTYERQVQQLDDLRVRGQRLAAEQADANKKGVQGSDQVVAARQRIADADRKVGDARRGVTSAQQQLQAAEDAADRARLAGRQRVADAERALGEARRAQQAQQRQGAFQLAQASQAVVSAQRALRQASVQAGTAGGSAMQKLNQQMAQLSPNAQKLVRTLYGLKTPFGELKKFVQDRLLDGVAGQVKDLAGKWLPALRPMLGGLADQFNKVGDGLFKALGRPEFIKNIGTAVRGFGDMFARIGKSLPGVVDAFGRIGAASAPVLRTIGDLVGGIFDKFSAWIKSADQSGALQSFMKDAAASLRQIFSIGGLVFRIIGQLVAIFFPQSKKSSDGFLGGVQQTLQGVLGWLKDPKNQQAIRDWVDRIREFVRFVTDVVVVNLVGTAKTINGVVSTVAGWVRTVSGWGKAVGGFFGDAARVLAAVWATIRDRVFTPLFTAITVTVPGAFKSGRDAIAARFAEVRDRLASVWATIRDNTFGRLRTLVGTTIPAVFRDARDKVAARFAEARDRLSGVWASIRDNTLGRLREWIATSIPTAFRDARDRVSARFAEARDRLSAVWASIRDNVFGKLASAIRSSVPEAFRNGVSAIRKAWDGVASVAKKPVDFVVRTVLNTGIIGSFNKIASVLPGVDKIPAIPWPPKGWATGGVLPGYTPGRDVHRFVSPTGGIVDLSGGEAIMRPEVTRAVGKGWVNSVNAAARSGGVSGVRRALSGSFASGGILGRGGDGIGDLWSKAKKKVGDVLTGAKDLISDPAGMLRNLADKVINTIPGQNTAFGKLAAAVPRKLVGSMVDRLKNLFVSGGGQPQGGPGNGSSPFGGSAGMMRVLRAKFPGLQLISGFRPGAVTLSGNKSYHSVDRAVDVPPIKAVAKYIYDTYKPITKELITPYQQYNLHNGQNHTYTGSIWNQHNFAGGNAHDHWAAKLGGVYPGINSKLLSGKVQLFDNGGLWPSGTLGANLSGRTEFVQPRQPAGGSGNTYKITVNVAPGAHPAETGRQIVTAIQAYERSNGARWRN